MYEVFEKLLEQRGVTAYQVSKATGITTASFTGWKKGKYNLKQDKLKLIADYFGVSLQYLMTGEEEGYYLSEETAEVAQEIFDTPGMKVLFDAARDSKPEDLQMAADLLNRLKETNPNG